MSPLGIQAQPLGCQPPLCSPRSSAYLHGQAALHTLTSLFLPSPRTTPLDLEIIVLPPLMMADTDTVLYCIKRADHMFEFIYSS